MATTKLSLIQQLCLTFILTLVLTLTWTTTARADGPGDLDTSFNGTGIVTTPISSGNDGGFSVAVQPDNKLVVAGTSYSGSIYSFSLIRYTITGSLDSTLNNTGIVTTPISNYSDIGYSVAIQPDGRIVVAGASSWSGFGPYFTVVRYTITGNLDTDFNSTGIVTTPIGANFGEGRSVAIQPDDGKIVVAGESEDASHFGSDFAVVRYNTDGSLDNTFNNTGIVTTALSNGFDAGRSVVIQPDGKIVVAGGSNGNFAVARYTITGSLDSDFGNTGVVTIPNGSGNSIALQADDKIVVAGGSSDGDFVVIRRNTDGSPDTSFNNTGIVTTPISSDGDTGFSVAIQPDGKIVVAGTSSQVSSFPDSEYTGNFAVVRYNSDGGLDTTFSNTGIVTTVLSSKRDVGLSVTIQPGDGKIVVTGFNNSGDNNADLAVVRYLGDGPKLTLTKSVNNDNPNPGEVITYTLTISNSGNLTATNTLISDTLPADLTLAGAVTTNPPDAGTIGTPPTLISGLTIITPDEQITVTFPVTVSTDPQEGLILTNTAAVTSDEIILPITAIAVITIAADPAITVSKQAHLTTAEVGEIITYTYRVTNTGNVTLSPVTASDDRLGTIMLTQTTLAPDEWTIGTLTYTTTGSNFPGPLTNTVTVTGMPSTGWPVTASDIETVAIQDTKVPTFPTNPLITPTQGITVNTPRPTFDWQNANDNADVVSYTLTITGSSPFTRNVVIQDDTATVTTTESIFTPTVDLPNAVYTWTVSAHDATGNIGTVITPANFVVQAGSKDVVHLPIILKKQ